MALNETSEDYRIYLEVCERLDTPPKTKAEWQNWEERPPAAEEKAPMRPLINIDLPGAKRWLAGAGMVLLVALMANRFFLNHLYPQDYDSQTQFALRWVIPVAAFGFLLSVSVAMWLEAGGDTIITPLRWVGFWWMVPFVVAGLAFSTDSHQENTPEKHALAEEITAQMEGSSCLLDSFEFGNSFRIKFYDERPDGWFDLTIHESTEPRIRPDVQVESNELTKFYVNSGDSGDDSVVMVTDLVDVFCD